MVLLTILCATPLVVAGIVSWWPGNRPQKKFFFVIVAAALAYGFGLITYLFAVPFALVKFELHHYFEVVGHIELARLSYIVEEVVGWIALAVGVVASFLVPVSLRRRYWQRLVSDRKESGAE